MCISTYNNLTERPRTHRDAFSLLLLVPAKNLENAAVKLGVYLCVGNTSIECISTYNNLTERPRTHWDAFSLLLRLVPIKNLENAAVSFGTLSRVKNTSIGHISAYNDLMEQLSTHHDGFVEWVIVERVDDVATISFN